MELELPWLGTDGVVCADSNFAFVETAKILYGNSTRFTGPMKTAGKKYPMKALSETAIDGRGHSISMRSLFQIGTDKYDMLAVALVDRNRRYFVSTVRRTTPGDEQVVILWRKRDSVSPQVIQSVTICLLHDY